MQLAVLPETAEAETDALEELVDVLESGGTLDEVEADGLVTCPPVQADSATARTGTNTGAMIRPARRPIKGYPAD